MILPPNPMRRFRTVLRKAMTGKPREPDPEVLIQSDGEQVIFFAALGEVSVQLQFPHALPPQKAIIPMSRFSNLEDAKTLSPVKKQKLPPLPSIWSEMPEHFGAALHEAGRSTAKEATKFALHDIQLRGKQGCIVASDGRQGLIQSGFSFPFQEDLYLPAIPVFGMKEFQTKARIGRTPQHCVIQWGEWTFWLSLDLQARYPDVQGVIPRSHATTRIDLSEADARWLLEHAKELGDETHWEMTLDVTSERVLIRWRCENHPVREVHLASTSASGPEVQLALERTHLERLLRLGFRQVQIAGGNKPLVASEPQRTFVAMVLDPTSPHSIRS